MNSPPGVVFNIFLTTLLEQVDLLGSFSSIPLSSSPIWSSSSPPPIHNFVILLHFKSGTRTKTSIRYAKENDREKTERRRDREKTDRRRDREKTERRRDREKTERRRDRERKVEGEI